MIQISIDPEIKKLAKNLALGIIFARVKVKESQPEIFEEIEKCIKEIKAKIKLDSVSKIPQIKALRNFYKVMGKDPARYRGSQEALIRRILQGKSFPQINNVVDIGNLISLKTFHSLGVYDFEKINPPVIFRKGKMGEFYEGIGKEKINLENLPVLADKIGPFGTPTSDSQRTMITQNTKKIMMVIFSFEGKEFLNSQLKEATNLLKNYAEASEIETLIVE